MLEQIRTALRDIAADYRDARIHHCRLELAALEASRAVLAGTVLDADTRDAATAALAARFSGITFEAGQVRVLRMSPPQLAAVSTNVTGLYAGPSFRDEMVSQLVSGCVVELLSEEERWVYVRQADGYLGWAYRQYVTAEPPPPPTHVVSAPVAVLQSHPDRNAAQVTRLAGGTGVQVVAVEGSWAHLALAGGLAGWLPAAELRGLATLPGDELSRRQQIAHAAARFTGVPYLWGGCTAFGFDCSGFAQLLHRLVGLTIPRDADMQYAAGQPTEPPLQAGDLLFFSEARGHRAITHVGMSLGGWRMVHSSRSRNGVYEDDVQAASWLRDIFVGARTFMAQPAP